MTNTLPPKSGTCRSGRTAPGPESAVGVAQHKRTATDIGVWR